MRSPTMSKRSFPTARRAASPTDSHSSRTAHTRGSRSRAAPLHVTPRNGPSTARSARPIRPLLPWAARRSRSPQCASSRSPDARRHPRHYDRRPHLDGGRTVRLDGRGGDRASRPENIDGGRHFAVSLRALPSGTPIDLVKRDEWPQEYIQAARGGRQAAHRRAASARWAGGYEQFVIGRSEADSEALTEIISWSGGSSAVARSEVLTTDEVVNLFVAYYHTGTVPPVFSRRPLAAPTRQ